MHVPKNVAMLSRRILWGFALSLALAPSVLAGEFKLGPKAVLELFTSQGCSSCPKADAMFEQVGKRPDIVTLAYHVDYWDYIGWQDTFGTAENSDRQRDYAEAWGSSRIFTPQMVVNGKGGVVGSKTEAVNGALASATLPLTVSLTEQQGGLIDISVPAQADLPAGTIWLVTFLDHADVTIERGENEGKRIGYTQIVTGRQVLGMWDPKTGAKLTLPVREALTGKANGAVIMVQQEKAGLPGPILGAASFTL